MVGIRVWLIVKQCGFLYKNPTGLGIKLTQAIQPLDSSKKKKKIQTGDNKVHCKHHNDPIPVRCQGQEVSLNLASKNLYHYRFRA